MKKFSLLFALVWIAIASFADVPNPLYIRSSLMFSSNKTTAVDISATGNASGQTLTWTSSDASVATVADGVVTPVGPGEAVITAADPANASNTATCNVTYIDGANLVASWDGNETVGAGSNMSNFGWTCTLNDNPETGDPGFTFEESNYSDAYYNYMRYDINRQMKDATGKTIYVRTAILRLKSSATTQYAVNLVAGKKYRFTAKVAYGSNNQTYTVNINTAKSQKGTTLKNWSVTINNSTYNTNTFYPVDLEFTATTTGEHYICFGTTNASKQNGFVNEMCVVEVPVTVDLVALNNAIAAAEAKTLGFDAGDYAPYNNLAPINALANAKTVRDNSEATQTEVDNAVAALTAATWTVNTEELNAFAPNMLTTWDWFIGNTDKAVKTYTDGDANYDKVGMFVTNSGDRKLLYFSWTSNTGAWAIFGNKTGYTMPLKAGVEYLLTFDYATLGTNFNPTVVVADANGPGWSAKDALKTPSYTTPGLLSSDNYVHVAIPFTPAVDGGAFVKLYAPGDANKGDMIISNLKLMRAPAVNNSLTVVSVLPAGDNANYVKASTDPGADYEATSVVLTDGVTYDNSKVVKAASLAYNRTLPATTDWQPLYLPFDLPISEWDSFIYKNAEGKYEVYTLKSENTDYVIFQLADQEKPLAAGTPYIFIPKDNSGIDMAISLENATLKKDAITKSTTRYQLKGTFEPLNMKYTGNEQKLFGLGADGFRWTSKDNYLKPFRSYLVDTDAKKSMSSIIGIQVQDETEETDGINAINADVLQGGTLYDMQGRVVEHPGNGIYILNGRKVKFQK